MGLILLALVAVPVVGVLLFAVVPPTPTILMLQQAAKGQGLDYRWRGLNDISPNLVNAAIAAEDARFCSHHGFDMEAIQKALDQLA
jgi:monofunctional biosynthetic peptidoglycan transglycosylase